MMYSQNRDEMRRAYAVVWEKYQRQAPLSSLEQDILAVILDHPDYLPALCGHAQDKDYDMAGGEINPFLHCALHLSIREQIHNDRPQGIKAAFVAQQENKMVHDVEHQFMQVLQDFLWDCQQTQNMPDENDYLARLLGAS